jgi:hypothetical protein
MYATVRHYEGVSDPSEVARIANEGFLPSTSIFESASGEEESNWRAGEFVGQPLEPLLPNAPHMTAREVVAHTAR